MTTFGHKPTSVRVDAARIVRRVMNARYYPIWIEHALRRLAHALAPHTLRCRRCGAVFTATGPFSAMHSYKAFEHSISHESDAPITRSEALDQAADRVRATLKSHDEQTGGDRG